MINLNLILQIDVLFMLHVYKKSKRNTVQVSDLAFWKKFYDLQILHKTRVLFYEFANLLTSNIGCKINYKT